VVGHGFATRQSYPEKSSFVKWDNGLRGLIDPPVFSIFRP